MPRQEAGEVDGTENVDAVDPPDPSVVQQGKRLSVSTFGLIGKTLSKKKAKIIFTPSGKRGSFPYGTPVLDAARSLGVDVDSVCGGRGLCGRCQIICVEGEFAKHAITSRADNLSPAGDVEHS